MPRPCCASYGFGAIAVRRDRASSGARRSFPARRSARGARADVGRGSRSSRARASRSDRTRARTAISRALAGRRPRARAGRVPPRARRAARRRRCRCTRIRSARATRASPRPARASTTARSRRASTGCGPATTRALLPRLDAHYLRFLADAGDLDERRHARAGSRSGASGARRGRLGRKRIVTTVPITVVVPAHGNEEQLAALPRRALDGRAARRRDPRGRRRLAAAARAAARAATIPDDPARHAGRPRARPGTTASPRRSNDDRAVRRLGRRRPDGHARQVAATFARPDAPDARLRLLRRRAGRRHVPRPVPEPPAPLHPPGRASGRADFLGRAAARSGRPRSRPRAVSTSRASSALRSRTSTSATA